MSKVKYGVCGIGLVVLSACETPLIQRDNSEFMPLIGGKADVVASTPLAEMRRLQLISTNLVSALVQVPEMKVGTATLQVSNPTTAFGNTLVRALEDAGFGIQRVSADQGLNYVTYGKRLSETFWSRVPIALSTLFWTIRFLLNKVGRAIPSYQVSVVISLPRQRLM